MTGLAVFVNTQFEGAHHWPDAPDEVAFLRTMHRHTFHVYAEVAVFHDDRDVEFILLKRRVDEIVDTIRGHTKPQEWMDPTFRTARWSCERWAQEIRAYLKADGLTVRKITVSEDGENGAIFQS